MILIVDRGIGFCAYEIRQDVIAGPAVIAELSPLVIVARVSANVDHVVEDT